MPKGSIQFGLTLKHTLRTRCIASDGSSYHFVISPFMNSTRHSVPLLCATLQIFAFSAIILEQSFIILEETDNQIKAVSVLC